MAGKNEWTIKQWRAGYLGVTEAECMKKGCCWKPVEDPSHTIPWCFYPGSAYDVKSSTPRGGPSAFTPYFPQICVTCRRVIEPLKGLHTMSKA